MKKWILMAAVALLIMQCAPSKKFPTDEKGYEQELYFCAPTKLTAKPGNRSLFLKWNTNCPPNVLLSGYNIYLLDEPMAEKYLDGDLPSRIQPYNSSPYPGDTEAEGDYETILIDGLDNGKEYYATVRTVFPDGHQSVSSNQVGAICRPEGEFRLAARFADINDGFSFAKARTVRADAADNDIYFFNKDGIDFFASPHRLNGFLRKSELFSLGQTKDIYQYPKFDLDIPSMDKIPIRAGDSYAVKTADGNFVKIRIESISGEAKERSLRIKYIYQTVPRLLRF